jgi:hypothetical protein
MNSWGILGRLIEQLDCSREGEIGVAASQRSRPDSRKIFAHNDRRGRGGFGECGILRVGHEGDLSDTGFFNARNASDLHLPRAVFKARSDKRCNLCKLHRKASQCAKLLIVMEARISKQPILVSDWLASATWPEAYRAGMLRYPAVPWSDW